MKFKLVFERKKSIYMAFVLFAALFISGNGFSQTIKPGIRAAWDLSNWNLSSVTGVEALPLSSPGAGVFALLNISRSFSVEPAINLSYLGAKLKYSDIEHITSKLTYLQIPVVARYQLQNRLAFFTGPQVSFLLKATMSENDGEKHDGKPSFKKNDLSIVSGVEYCFTDCIGVRANYTAGLTNIYAQGNEKITNYSYGIGMTYRFNAAKKKGLTKK